MGDLRWFDVYPPRQRDLADVTAMVRTLAGRGRQGMFRVTPIVVFELWIERGHVRWLLGVDKRLVTTIPKQLRAQMSGLVLAHTTSPTRPALSTAMTVRSTSLSFPLRLDTAAAVRQPV